MSDVWYLAKDGKEFGPFSLIELHAKLRGFDLRDLFVWRDGFDDWKPAEEIAELKPRPPKPPPFSKPADSTAAEAAGMQNEPPQKSGVKSGLKGLDRAIGIVVALISMVLARALGAVFWLPVVLVGGTYYLLGKVKVAEPVRPMMAFLIGHMAWMVIGFAALYFMRRSTEFLFAASLDLLAVVGLSIWVLKRTSLASVSGVLVYQLVGICYLVIAGDETHVGQVGLGMHIILRTLGAATAIYALWVLWNGVGADARQGSA